MAGTVDYGTILKERLKDARDSYNGMIAFADELKVPRLASAGPALFTAGIVLAGSMLYVIAIFFFVSLGTTLVKAVLQTIKAIRQDGAADFAEVTSDVLGEFMAIDTKDVDFKAGKDPASSLARAKQLGDIIITMLQKQFGEAGPQTPDQGETAAKALAGYGVNFATSNVFLSWLVELSTEGHFGDFDKLGEDIAKTLGLGRLTRRALQPLIRNAISHPYDRKMRALYRPDIPAVGELIKAALAGRMTEPQARAYIAQHGFDEEHITEMFAQHTPGLKSHDISTLRAYGAIDASTASGMLKGDGIPDSIASWQLQLYDIQRLAPLRHAYANEALQLAQQRFIDPPTLSVILAKSGLPADEQQLYMNRLGLWLESEHKRLSKLDVLYLYEHGQLTIDEVETWATEQGYNAQDRLALLLEFLSKSGGRNTKTPEQIAQAAAHQHNEHVAFVKDQFEASQKRQPTTAELLGWVSLLDTKSRTKGDVKTEIKADPNPPSL